MQVSTSADALSYTVQSNLHRINRSIAKSTERLSSGYKINHASDDAAVLAIAQNISSQISGNTVAQSNIQQGTLVLNTIDSGLNSITTNLNNIRNLVVEAASGSYDQSQRDAMRVQAQAYLDEINSIASSTSFNGMQLLDGSISTMVLQVGANGDETMDIAAACESASGDDIGLSTAGLTTAFSSSYEANQYIATVDDAISQISSQRGIAGAYTNTLTTRLDTLSTKITNLEASHSALMDTDYASESTKLTNLQILQEANISLLAQLNSQKSIVLKLLE